MRALAIAALIAAAACGGKQKPPASADDDTTLGSGSASAAPKLSELERRRHAACEQLGPKLTQCAIEDAKATGSKEALEDLDKTAPLHTKKFIEQCESGEMSSRQVRVLEVCYQQAPSCDELTKCLENLQPQAP